MEELIETILYFYKIKKKIVSLRDKYRFSEITWASEDIDEIITNLEGVLLDLLLKKLFRGKKLTLEDKGKVIFAETL